MERTDTPALLDKLGLRPGMRVAVVGPIEEWFLELARSRTSRLSIGSAEADTDLAFLGADSIPELAPLPALRRRLRPNGGIWIVSRKGRAAGLRYAEILAVAREHGLVDNKVVAFSETHTALRFVIPLALRPPAARPGPSRR